jgi:AraC family transcriptional regulator
MQSESSSQIRSLLRGSSILGRSCSQAGFTIEHHEVAAGEKPEIALEQHFVGVWAEPCYGERWNLRGKRVVFSKRPGTITLLPMGWVPRLRLSSPAEVSVVAFEPKFIESVSDELEQPSSAPFLGRFDLEDPELSMLVSLLMQECNSGCLHGGAYAESLAHAIAIRFIHLGRGEPRRGVTYRHISSPQSIRRVLDRMHAEFNTDLSLGTLVAETGYSRRHFLRIFEEATGYTPHQYLLLLRMRRAKELIRKTSMPLVDIAEHTGFSNQSHMSQIFRKHFGSVPSQIRRDLCRGQTTNVRNNPLITGF